WLPYSNPFQGAHVVERGYTGHEHLDSIELIHMGGRVQDPVLGRFISADPIVQSPYVSQSHNRYSYVWNNPLRYVDPTGYCTAGDDWTDCPEEVIRVIGQRCGGFCVIAGFFGGFDIGFEDFWAD